MKRIDGAPTASAEQIGARGAAFAAEQGARTAANLRDVGVNVDLAPVLDVARPGSDTEETERGFGSSAAARLRHRDPLRRGVAGRRRRRHRQALPGPRQRPPQHRLRGPAGSAPEVDAARRRRGPVPALRRDRRRDGDDQQRDLPGALAEAGRLLAVDRHRRAAHPPRLRGRLDHRRARQRRRRRLRRAGEGRGGGGPRRHRRAALHRLPVRRPRRGRPAARAANGEAEARRVRSLRRPGPAPAPGSRPGPSPLREGRPASRRGARRRGRRPLPRTSPRRPRRAATRCRPPCPCRTARCRR